MVKTNPCKLWYQGLAFLEYYTAFMIKFPAATSEFPRQSSNFENSFTGPPTKTMLKIGFADALLLQQLMDHRLGWEVN